MLVALAARADTRIDAKVHCKQQYGSATDLDAACERGVDISVGTPGDDALAACARDDTETDDPKAVACRRGVAFHSGVAMPQRERGEKSSFSSSWRQGHGAVQVEIGGYDVLIGDAQKSIADCQSSFDGSKTPPSCLSGFRIQPQPPGRPPATTAGP